MRYRLTITAAVAVLAASFSLFTVISGAGWLAASAGAVIVAAGAGLITRLGGIAAAAAGAGLVLVASLPLLAGGSWPERIGGVVLVAAVAGSAATRRALPVLAGAGTYLAALFLYLNLVFAGGRSWAWVIPTARSARQLGRLVSAGYAEHVYAPPVPGIRGLELIAAAGVGLVAVLTDLIAVRLRSPAVAGLPLLVLFSVPVATNVKNPGVGLTLAFCLGISGYLALLSADGRERLRLWGRLVTVWRETPEDEDARGPDTRAVAASGRRIGLAAVVLAVIVPLVLPGVKTHGLLGTSPAPGGSGGGGPQVAGPAPLVRMRNQLLERAPEPVLTYRTDASDPPQQYLQMYVLNYDGKSAWTLQGRSPSVSVAGQALPPPPGLAAATNYQTAHTTITLGPATGGRDLSYLPAPYAPELVTGEGAGWQDTASTLMLYGFRSDAGLRYAVTSQTADPTRGQELAGGKLPASIKRSYLSYPGPNRARLAKIAAAITRGARTPFARAVALQSYFTKAGRFTYALRGNLPKTVLQFLTTDRRGFCQQFAFSMAVLARLAGIPSRVAVGYTAGTDQSGTWHVTSGDAHAWPELYFAGTGWLRFEPTPNGPAGQGTATPPSYSVPVLGRPGGTNPGGVTSSPAAPAGAGTGKGNDGLGAGRKVIPEGTGGPTGHGGAAAGGFPVALVVLLVIVVLLAAPGLSRLLIRRRRWRRAGDDAGRAHAAWRELTSDLADLGLTGAPSESPRALARRVAAGPGLDEAAQRALHRIAAAEERARYARTPAAADSLQADGRLVRKALARQVTRPQRWRARLWPASAISPVAAGLREAADVFGWLDAAGMRIRRAARGGPGRPRRAD